MSQGDWYRRRTWTERDRAEFFERLARCRSDFHRAQYARIQALELFETGEESLVPAALALLDRIVESWWDEAQRALVQHQRARCLLDLGQFDDALAAFRAAFDEQRSDPHSRSNAHLDFAWWVGAASRRDLFDEAITALEEFGDGDALTFPATRYLSEGAQALILSARGEQTRAVHHARAALEALGEEHSGLSYHPKVGLARVHDQDAQARLVAIATGSS